MRSGKEGQNIIVCYMTSLTFPLLTDSDLSIKSKKRPVSKKAVDRGVSIQDLVSTLSRF